MHVNGDQSGPFADWMKTVRTAESISQLDLSERMGVDKSLVSRVESGQNRPTADFVVAFAHAMKVDVRDALLQAGFPVSNASWDKVQISKETLDLTRLLDQIDSPSERERTLAAVRAVILSGIQYAQALKKLSETNQAAVSDQPAIEDNAKDDRAMLEFMARTPTEKKRRKK